MADFGSVIRKAFSFCIDPRRWLQLLALDLSFMFIGLLVLVSSSGFFLDAAETGFSEANAGPLIGLVLGLIVLILAWLALRLWITGALIRQAARPDEFTKSYDVSIRRLHRIALSVIVIGLLSAVVSSFPTMPLLFTGPFSIVVGWVGSIVISLVFFFVLQGIIIDDLGVIGSLRNSLRIFSRDHKDVLIGWIVIALISASIALIFMIPLLLMFLLVTISMIPMGGTPSPDSIAMFILLIQTNLAQVIGTVMVAAVGIEISQAFSIKAQTELYLQLRKALPGLLKSLTERARKMV